MTSELAENIAHIRQQLRLTEDSGQRQSELVAKREEIENSIHQLTSTIEQQKRQLHTQSTSTPSQLVLIEKQVDLLRQLKQKKKEVDHWLDDLEDSEPKSATGFLEQQLARQLLQLRPDEKEHYLTLLRQKQNSEITYKELEQLSSYGNDLCRFLSKAISEGQQVKKGGFLRFVMGTNPNKVILACLDGVEKTARQALITLHKCSATDSSVGLLSSTYDSLETALKELAERSRDHWNYRILAKEYPAHLESLRVQLESIEQRHAEALHYYRQKEKQLREWLLDEPLSPS